MTNNLDIKLKWPNDLMLNDKKFGGILIENTKEFSIVGIGMNLQGHPNDLGNAAYQATSINCNISPDILAEMIYYELSTLLESGKMPKWFINEWKKSGFKLHEEVTISYGGNTISGIFTDISEVGEIILQTSDGIRKISFGDVM